jgi:hypothetical protein
MSIVEATRLLATYLERNGISKVAVGRRSSGVAYRDLEALLKDVIEMQRKRP